MLILTTPVFNLPLTHILCIYGHEGILSRFTYIGRTPTTEHNLFCSDVFQEHPHVNYVTCDVHIQDIYILTTIDEEPKFIASIHHPNWNYLRWKDTNHGMHPIASQCLPGTVL